MALAAGQNIRVDVWRYSFPTDDEIGGAVSSGTRIYEYVQARMQAEMPDQVFLQQGLEVTRSFTFSISPPTLLIYERDELEVVFPPEHRYYGQRFRVKGEIETNYHPRDPRGHLLLQTTRSQRAHGDQ